VEDKNKTDLIKRFALHSGNDKNTLDGSILGTFFNHDCSRAAIQSELTEFKQQPLLLDLPNLDL